MSEEGGALKIYPILYLAINHLGLWTTGYRHCGGPLSQADMC